MSEKLREASDIQQSDYMKKVRKANAERNRLAAKCNHDVDVLKDKLGTFFIKVLGLRAIDEDQLFTIIDLWFQNKEIY